MIPLRVHNVLDYLIGAVLVLCPYLFGFGDVDAARGTFLALGVALVGYSLLTRYRYSLFKLIPIRAHMALDVALGIVIMLAPTLFGYQAWITGGQYVLHFVLGLGAIGLVALTERRPTASAEEVEEERRKIKRIA